MLLMLLGEDSAVWATTELKEVEFLARFYLAATMRGHLREGVQNKDHGH